MIQPLRKTINTPFIGKNSPSQYLGVKLDNFSVSQLFLIKDKNNTSEAKSLLKQEVTEARRKIYQDIVLNLKDLTNFSDTEEGVRTNHYFEEYQDFLLKTQLKPDRERLVIRIIRLTPRQTILSTICRFYTNGTNLYIALDSYLLGKIRIVSIVFHTLLLLVFLPMFLGGLLGIFGVLAILATIISNPLQISSLFLAILPLIIPGLYLYFSWFPVVKALVDGETFMAALKHRFHNKAFRNIFDKDDGLTYLKSVLPFIVDQIEAVLASHGINDPNIFEKLTEIKEAILAQPNVTLNNSGSIFGIQIGNSNIQENS